MQSSSMSNPSFSSAERTSPPVRVLKFGGTAIGTAERLHDAVRIIRGIHRPEASGTRIGPAVPSSHC